MVSPLPAFLGQPRAPELPEPPPDVPELPSADGLVSPVKVLRLSGLLEGLLDELDRAPVDEAARRSLVASYRAVLIEVASTVSEALVDEMERLHIAPLQRDATTEQIRLAEAQLLGWVKGLVASGGIASGGPLSADAYMFQVLVTEDQTG
jgi:hypothetical protein